MRLRLVLLVMLRLFVARLPIQLPLRIRCNRLAIGVVRAAREQHTGQRTLQRRRANRTAVQCGQKADRVG